ncbi:hypothetical protein BEN47_06030 [Hymenobacter lapidarius]|uniref:Uncharacterized protein n=1 Tax=Hymenobacter lapidarius TaxID=1908237 RepID=A0A1G1SQB8_9BACT|nr:hypothetical protein BEN47_06030 [Hymenobacter lapidarius]
MHHGELVDGLRFIKQPDDGFVDELVRRLVEALGLEQVDDRGEGIFFQHERAKHGHFELGSLGRQLAGRARVEGDHPGSAAGPKSRFGSGCGLLQAVVHPVLHRISGV